MVSLPQFKVLRPKIVHCLRMTGLKLKAERAQKEWFGGKKVWICIRDMQCGRRGLLPSVSVSIKDENGTLVPHPHQNSSGGRDISPER